MNKDVLATGIILAGLGVIGFKAFKQHRARKAEDAKLMKVRASVADLIKDVPGYNPPSR